MLHREGGESGWDAAFKLVGMTEILVLLPGVGFGCSRRLPKFQPLSVPHF